MIEFAPNCTFPTTSPSGLIRAPNIRSTMEVVWNCTSIIILSTWSVLHLTVPPDLKPMSKLQGFRKHVYLLGRKLVWMGVMPVFLEYLVSITTTNLFTSWVNNPRLKQLATDDNVPWSLTHTILANMGGIAIRFSEPVPQQHRSRRIQTYPGGISSTSNPDTNSQENHLTAESICTETGHRSGKHPACLGCSWPLSQPGFLGEFRQSQEKHLKGLGDAPWKPFSPHAVLASAARADTHVDLGSEQHYRAKHIAPLHGNLWVLDSKQLAIARARGVIPRLPCLEENEINDKSKSDGLVRCLAIMQVLWLVAQLVVRYVKAVTFSALEVSTLAFSACAFIIYLSEWSKPKDVGVPFYIDTKAEVSLETFALIAEAAPISFLQARHYYIPQSVVHQVLEGRYTKKHIDRIMILASILSIMLFGGLHLLAWNLDFPTPIEGLLWRSSALTIAIAPIISSLLVLLESVLFHRTDRYAKWAVTILGPLYLFARLFLLVESYRSLYFLPPGALISTWASEAPHIG
ncbi:hypothetical protein ACHAPT_003958 [Fusarium lateritium]